MNINKLLVAAAATTVAATALTFAGPASAHTTGLHDNCTNLNKTWPHGVGLANARDLTSGTPVTTFYRNTKAYRAAEGHNGTLDADNDGIACEKR
ncbi:excalibur calcium-binding domain-containing protein [Nocardioides sp. Soil805]|uniref:excalibur calcium-binding domain-containing protein n=1 Tax=Nocardioides sp. Soil805 TaxID=1736416 RepID=UPI0007039BF8|nr:excalibur calcium-binding domain-containing protein [Nocardioides sp. Soil805]KRF34678.1 hypothetical protein ASG94_10895 [Nocardioides sp. Soil805]